MNNASFLIRRMTIQKWQYEVLVDAGAQKQYLRSQECSSGRDSGSYGGNLSKEWK
jgi:hypothetical protein